ncbi:hypothetical protein MCOR27_005848 [Pyricularia oryzae]|uniref:Uncharacterized protein n=1 Tax=Pyricularia grisea TaxID=148305 RepID=A0ABQ8P121_PYRGI|nr:hypothetical protein MCOR19_007334 [Pyricularia oryzae]KAI6304983.1 hypothetical protein MCOR33_000102 [Pyricularia grisea]KAI6277872.1 hypothetical protein MCOR27_005848 [Pyricularia oryzae]KAI6287982.1 hypothetical protein MCOR26_000393 [Pyricularia oryzae]KAI6332874.1 hypothetical protein MCOR30_004407 [Pyricularia oryzae]
MRISSLLGAALFGTFATAAATSTPVQGSFVVELQDGETSEALYQTLSREDGLETQERRRFSSKLFNGASFLVSGAGGDSARLLDIIKSKPTVKAVWPVKAMTIDRGEDDKKNGGAVPAAQPLDIIYKRQTADGNSSDVDTFRPHIDTQIDMLHAKGIKGNGKRVAIIDSGVDWKHPALGGCFGPGCVIEGGWDFVGDADFEPGVDIPVEDPDPYDNCEGHGTHVTGIIVAQPNPYGFTGAAPGAKIRMYRAWNCHQKSNTEIYIAAFLRAFDEGADIISLSAGQDGGWEDEPWAMVASRIADAGVPVVVAVGNDGGAGMFYTLNPAAGRSVLGVGSVRNTLLPELVAAGSYSTAEQQNVTFALLQGTPTFPHEMTLPLWAVGNDTASINDACSPLSDNTPDLSDKLVLLRVPDSRATRCYPLDQAANILAKGGRYMAYYVPDNTSFNDQFVYAEGISGVLSVAPFQGAQWIDLLNRGIGVNVTVPGPSAPNTTLIELENKVSGGYMSTFTTWGPTNQLSLKPSVAAPGGSIFGTFPLALGGYRVLSGTSMACPLTAGAFALVGEVRGTMDPKLIAGLLESTAKPLVWFDGTNSYPDKLAPVAQQGAGIIRAFDAAYSKTTLSKANFPLNDTEHFVGTHQFTIENTGSDEATYALGHTRAPTQHTLMTTIDGSLLQDAFPNPMIDTWASLEFSQDSVTVPAGGSAQVEVTFTQPPTTNGLNATLLPIYGGYVNVNSTRGENLVIPYLGAAGSMRATPLLTSNAVYLANGYSTAPANRTYTLTRPSANSTLPIPGKSPNDDVTLPNVYYRLLLGTSIMHVDLVSLDDAKNVGPKTPTGIATMGAVAGWPLRHLSRTQQRAYFVGKLADSTVVPAGSYKIVLTALRVFGDQTKVEDWDFIETVPFNIEYK